MIATGIVRKADDLGRIVLPKELRDLYGIEKKTPIEIFTDDGFIMIRVYNPNCAGCGNSEKLRQVGKIKLCEHCIKTLKNH